MPAPKTVIVETCLRLLKIRVAARAVRKAVISSALIRPRGAPLESRRVRDPLGVVLWLLAMEGGGSSKAVVEEEGVELESEREGLLLRGLDPTMVTIFIPVESLDLAGMKSVVEPSLRVSDVRSSWFVEQQPSSSVPLEYSWRASAREC